MKWFTFGLTVWCAAWMIGHAVDLTWAGFTVLGVVCLSIQGVCFLGNLKILHLWSKWEEDATR